MALSEEEIAARRLIACPTFVNVDDQGVPLSLIVTSKMEDYENVPLVFRLEEPEDFDFDVDNIDVNTGAVIKNARQLPEDVFVSPPLPVPEN